MQEENERTKHIQGCIMFTNAVRFGTLKTLAPSFHWGVCKKDFQASINYCSMKTKRKGRLWYKGCDILKKNSRDEILLSTEEIYEDMKSQLNEWYENEWWADDSELMDPYTFWIVQKNK